MRSPIHRNSLNNGHNAEMPANETLTAERRLVPDHPKHAKSCHRSARPELPLDKLSPFVIASAEQEQDCMEHMSLIGRGCITSALAVLLSVTAAQARTISFTDTNGALTGASSFAGDIVVCTGQPCGVLETYNPAAQNVLSGIVPNLYIGDQSGFVLDQLVTTNPQGFVGFELTSFFGGGVTCTSVGGCQVTADGTVQTVETIVFSVEVPTLVTFQSLGNQTLPTPEPSTVLLLALGGTILPLVRRIRRQA